MKALRALIPILGICVLVSIRPGAALAQMSAASQIYLQPADSISYPAQKPNSTAVDGPKRPSDPKCDYEWSIGAGFGISEYYGALGNGFFGFDMSRHNYGSESRGPGIFYLAANRYMTEVYDLGLKLYHGSWSYYGGPDSGQSFHRKVTGFEFTPRWKFLGNIYISSYLTAGVGFRRVEMSASHHSYGIFGADKGAIYEINLPAGLGVNIRLNDHWGINIQTNIAWTNNGKSSRENLDPSEVPSYDMLWNHTAGIYYNLGKKTRCVIF